MKDTSELTSFPRESQNSLAGYCAIPTRPFLPAPPLPSQAPTTTQLQQPPKPSQCQPFAAAPPPRPPPPLQPSPPPPRSAKRRQTPRRAAAASPDSSQYTSPPRSPLAVAGSVGTPMLLSASPKSSRKRLYSDLVVAEKPKWNPRDPAQMQAVKEALHVATVPSCGLVCRDDEQKRVLEFCKACVEQERGGSLYACGCPGTGKTLSINNVKESLMHWSDEMGMESPDSLAINCTCLANISDVFSKIFGKFLPRKKVSSKLSSLQQLQNMFSHEESAPKRMLLVIVDEMDYLITRDRAVLHDLFMLTTYQFSRCMLIGIANAIDLADRFLPKLESLNCKPIVVTFRAYSKDQILDIIKHRLKVLEYDVFEPLALEFCARKVAAASGDMRKALGVCRSAVEVLEANLWDSSDHELGTVTFGHMDIALSKAFKSAVVDSILSLPQHQQMALCALANISHHCKKKATTLGELNKSYIEVCRSTQVPAVGMLEFCNMCMVLSDQGLMKLGQSKEDKLRRVTLQIDSSDITFAFKENRFFQRCLELPRS